MCGSGRDRDGDLDVGVDRQVERDGDETSGFGLLDERPRPLLATGVRREGDVLLIANAGAYGRSMASSYNLRQPPEEIVLDT